MSMLVYKTFLLMHEILLMQDLLFLNNLYISIYHVLVGTDKFSFLGRYRQYGKGQ